MDSRRGDAADRRLRRLPRAADAASSTTPASIMKPVFAARQEGAARVRLLRGRGRARAARGAGGASTRASPSPILIGRPEVIDDAHRAARPAHRGRAATSSWSIRTPIRATRNCWQDYHQLMARNGVTPEMRQAGSAALDTTLIGAMLLRARRRRRHALRHRRPATPQHLHMSPTSSACEPGAHVLRRDEHADAAATTRCSSATPTSTTTRPPSSSPR